MTRSLLTDAAQTRRVVRMLQQIAKEAGHERPLMIGIDQENGTVVQSHTFSCGLYLLKVLYLRSVWLEAMQQVHSCQSQSFVCLAQTEA